jgi:hypothetical protein
MIAQPRWVVKNRTLHFCADGTEFKFPSWTPDEVVERIAQLPQDYMELGDAAADQKVQLRAEQRRRQVVEHTLAGLRARINGAGDLQRKDRLVVILQEDLEEALNLVFRLARAAGVQGSDGEVSWAINKLARKYGMEFK